MRDLLEYLTRALVDDPDAVEVEQFDEEDGTIVLEVSVGEDDMGKVIGKGGRTINSLRAVMRACSVKRESRVIIDVVD